MIGKIKRKRYLVAFVRVAGLWLASQLIVSALMVLGLLGFVLRNASLSPIQAEIKDIQFLFYLFFVVWMYFAWFLTGNWARGAGVLGLLLLGVWFAKRFLPWRRWLRLPPVQNNSDPVMWGM